MNISKINKEIEDFTTKSIQIVPGLFFNQKETIETCYYYHHSKFRTGEYDVDGDRKYFYNIVNNPCIVYTKAIDFDTKHINIMTVDGQDSLKTWFFERDLKFWMKDKQFGLVLNRIFKELPIFGSVVLKIINNTPYFVDLRNFFVSQSADSLDDSYFITEIHRYTVEQFRRMGKEMGWNNIEKTIDEFRKNPKQQYIDVYERYGDVEEYKGTEKVVNYKRIFIADVGIDEFDYQTKQTVPRSGVELKEDIIDTHPYFEFHLDKIPGRWLGVGVIETLVEPQIRLNEIANLQSKGSYWLSLRLFQTRDTAAKKNLMNEVSNGDVLSVDSEITPVNTTDPNLKFFNDETDKWLRNRDELTLSYDVMQGERMPAGTPLGSAKIAATMAMSYFDQIRENVALGVKELLYSTIIPNFEKENNKEHVLRIAGEDLDILNNLLINIASRKSVENFRDMNGKIPSKEQYEMMKAANAETIKKGKEKLTTIPKGFYKDLKYIIDIIITGESKDTAVYSQTMFAILQAVTTDPTILQDPNKKKMLYRIAEAGGVNPNTLFDNEQVQSMSQLAEMMTQRRGGGGVSRPAPAPVQQQMASTPTEV